MVTTRGGGANFSGSTLAVSIGSVAVSAIVGSLKGCRFARYARIRGEGARRTVVGLPTRTPGAGSAKTFNCNNYADAKPLISSLLIYDCSPSVRHNHTLPSFQRVECSRQANLWMQHGQCKSQVTSSERLRIPFGVQDQMVSGIVQWLID